MQIEWKLKVPHLPTMYSNSSYSNQVCAQLHNTWSNLFANLQLANATQQCIMLNVSVLPHIHNWTNVLATATVIVVKHRHRICRGRRGRHSQKGGEQEGHSIAEQSDEMVNLLWGLDLVVSPTAPNHIYILYICIYIKQTNNNPKQNNHRPCQTVPQFALAVCVHVVITVSSPL